MKILQWLEDRLSVIISLINLISQKKDIIFNVIELIISLEIYSFKS